jgi:hypothetical protein|eukprot:COSAG06_NODE_11645_length_1482_cov_1.345625_2_plen_241_part_00
MVLWFIIANQHVELAQRVEVFRQNLLFTLAHQQECAHRDADRDREDREHREDSEELVLARLALDGIVRLEHTHPVAQVAAAQRGERRLTHPRIEHEDDDANNRVDALHMAPPIECSDQLWEFARSRMQDIQKLVEAECSRVVFVSLENDRLDFVDGHVHADVIAAGGDVSSSHLVVFRSTAFRQAFVLVPQVLPLLVRQSVQVGQLVLACLPSRVSEEDQDSKDCGKKRCTCQKKVQNKK